MDAKAMSPGDRLALAARLSHEAEVLERRIALARRPGHALVWGREVRKRELAGLEQRAAEVEAELVALAGGER